MPNSLVRHVGFNAGPWVVETLVKHYFDQRFKDEKSNANTAKSRSGDLRRDELLYDETFTIVKSFLEASSNHTIEELQEFANVRTPSPPWIHVVRTVVPMSCCDEAGTDLIQVFGGADKTKEIVGGTKWWQVRGIQGVEAQWIVARKDYREAKKRRKMQDAERQRKGFEGDTIEEPENVYSPDMDELRCILYLHGGGFYFGSADQERYCMQRFARKSGCRLFAINYRLAPQYPFPCALQDSLAAYLYLIRPPLGSLHTPVNPAHIVISGDSAGGNLSLALLQVIRDSNLPIPAGGVLISPWCDLTHSFPSVHTNTETDIIPKYGLSLFKPSPLWPPPPDGMTEHVHTSLRTRIKRLAKQESQVLPNTSEDRDEPSDAPKRRLSLDSSMKHIVNSRHGIGFLRRRDRAHSAYAKGDVRSIAINATRASIDYTGGVDIGRTAPAPTAGTTSDQVLSIVTEKGEKLEVSEQVHLYTLNTLLTHPLVSPALSYLGGLPPLLVIASDAEVLRDEIVYSAHKAAHPDRYPVKPEIIQMYPPLKDIEKRSKPTLVHLQVYDQTAHTLPVLFPFCTPAKYCFRSMASFVKHFAGTPSSPLKQVAGIGSLGGSFSSTSSSSIGRRQVTSTRSLSFRITRRSPMRAKQRRSQSASPSPQSNSVMSSHDTGESVPTDDTSMGRVGIHSREPTNQVDDSIAVDEGTYPREAGRPVVYQRPSIGSPSRPFTDNMIRERVSITGELRELEPEAEIAACRLTADRIGVIGELSLRRFIEGRDIWNEKFAETHKSVRKQREKSLRKAQDESVRSIEQLQTRIFEDEPVDITQKTISEGLHTAASWSWAWALDDENPPPSSIVARRDTREARRLARIADAPQSPNEKRVSANNLWAFLVDKLNLEKTHARRQEATAAAVSDAAEIVEQSPDEGHVTVRETDNEISVVVHDRADAETAESNEKSSTDPVNDARSVERKAKHKSRLFERLCGCPSLPSFRKHDHLKGSTTRVPSHSLDYHGDLNRSQNGDAERGPAQLARQISRFSTAM